MPTVPSRRAPWLSIAVATVLVTTTAATTLATPGDEGPSGSAGAASDPGAVRAAAAPAIQMATVPADVDYEDTTLEAHDGTRLQVQVWRPAGVTAASPAPVFLTVTPYAGSDGAGVPSNSPLLVEGAWRRGWTHVEVSLRGYGSSEGCSDLLGPDDQADSVTAVEWAASQPWSDGRVVMGGLSYDAATTLAAAAGGAPLTAGWAGSGVPTHHEVTYDQGVPRNHVGVWVEGQEAIPTSTRGGLWFSYRTQAGPPSGDPTPFPRCVTDDVVGMLDGADPDSAYARARDMSAGLAEADAPMLFSYGFQDHQVMAEELGGWIYYGGPRAAVFGHQGHWAWTRPGAEAEILQWFEERLRGQPVAGPAVEVQDNLGTWRTEASYPPADATGFDLPILPGHVEAHPEQGSFQIEPDRMALTATQPLPHATRLAGQVVATIDHGTDLLVGAPDAGLASRVVALVYDVSPAGTAELVTRGAALLEADGSTTLDTQFTDWVVRPGHRLLLALAGDDVTAYEPYASHRRASIEVTGGSWTLPLLDRPAAPPPFTATPTAPIERIAVDGAALTDREVEAPLPHGCSRCATPVPTGEELLRATLQVPAAGATGLTGPPVVTTEFTVADDGTDVVLQAVATPSQPADLRIVLEHLDRRRGDGSGRPALAGLSGPGGWSIDAVTATASYAYDHDGSLEPGNYRLTLVNLAGPAVSAEVTVQRFR